MLSKREEVTAINHVETGLTASRQLHASLQELHLNAGKPSARSISRQLGDVSHTTVADLLSGRRISSWEIARRVVVHLGGDEAAFRALWTSAVSEGDRTIHNIISGSAGIAPVLSGSDFLAIDFTGASPAMTQVVPAQLPPLVTGFTGRASELEAISQLLDPDGPAVPTVVSAVAGVAGVGKTALAVQAGHLALDRGWFPGGALFIDLHGYDDGPVDPEQALDFVLRALGVVPNHIPHGSEERAALYRSVLAQIRDPLLLIVDNVAAELQLRPLLPGSGPHRVLVTSRHTLAGLGARLLEIGVLNEEASIGLLDARLRAARPDDQRISADHRAARLVAQMCDGLPLALQITAALLVSDPALGLDELAYELSDEMRRLGTLRYDDGSDAAVSVVGALDLSYRQLTDENARLFRLLSLNPGPDISAAAAAVLVGWPVRQTRAAISQLAVAHLVEAVPGAAGRWQMHDLVRAYARQASVVNGKADGREEALDRLLEYYMNEARAASQHLMNTYDTEDSRRLPEWLALLRRTGAPLEPDLPPLDVDESVWKMLRAALAERLLRFPIPELPPDAAQLEQGMEAGAADLGPIAQAPGYLQPSGSSLASLRKQGASGAEPSSDTDSGTPTGDRGPAEAAVLGRPQQQHGRTKRDDPSVTALVERARGGDSDAWQDLFERYAPLVWSICTRYRLEPVDIDDVAQTVWLLLVENIDTLREQSALPAWLATATRNQCLQIQRAAHRHPVPSLPMEDQMSADPSATAIEQQVMDAEFAAALQAAVAELPARYRELLSLLMNDPPMGYAQISERLRIPIGSIGPTRARCLDLLRSSSHLAPWLAARMSSGAAGAARLG